MPGADLMLSWDKGSTARHLQPKNKSLSLTREDDTIQNCCHSVEGNALELRVDWKAFRICNAHSNVCEIIL